MSENQKVWLVKVKTLRINEEVVVGATTPEQAIEDGKRWLMNSYSGHLLKPEDIEAEAEEFSFRGLLDCEVRPMDFEETKRMIFCMDMEVKSDPDLSTFDDFGVKVFAKRLQVCSPNLTVSGALSLFVISLSENIAEVVLWAYTLHQYARENSLTNLTMCDFAGKMFPMGIPTEEARHRVWKAQKAGGGNAVDNAILWEIPPLKKVQSPLDSPLSCDNSDATETEGPHTEAQPPDIH